jgi:hypothetical protein
MSNGPVQIGDSWYVWGLTGATETASLALEDTGLTLNGTTLWRIVPGAAAVGELLVEDGTEEFEFDDATGDVLYEG